MAVFASGFPVQAEVRSRTEEVQTLSTKLEARVFLKVVVSRTFEDSGYLGDGQSHPVPFCFCQVELGQKTELTEEKKRLLRRVHAACLHFCG